MYNITIIGDTGMGKSHLTRKLIGNRNCFIFDINNEYTDISIDKRAQRCRCLPDFNYDHDTFIIDASKRKKSMIVFEDATGFLSSNLPRKVKALIANKRHTGNYYIFLFHTINDVPKFILSMSSFIYVFRTNDMPTDVYSKERPALTEAFETLQMLTREQAYNKGKYIQIKQ
jgi:hypothetical protein